jgi:hypothetical protein
MKVKFPNGSAQFIMPSDEYNGINQCELCRSEFIPSSPKDDFKHFTDIFYQLKCIDEINQFYSKKIIINQDKIIELVESINFKMDNLSKQS